MNNGRTFRPRTQVVLHVLRQVLSRRFFQTQKLFEIFCIWIAKEAAIEAKIKRGEAKKREAACLSGAQNSGVKPLLLLAFQRPTLKLRQARS